MTRKDYILDTRNFNQSDINFIKRRTGLKKESDVLNLIEEDLDLCLLIDEISTLPLCKKQTTRLSLNFLLLLLICKYGKGKEINPLHKLVMANISSKYFNIVTKRMPKGSVLDFTKAPNENSAKLLFVLSGFFSEAFSHHFEQAEDFKQVKKLHVKYIEYGLKKLKAEQWAIDGLDILESITQNGWISRFLK